MKRSQINAHIADAEARFRDAGLFLPEWAHWTLEEWRGRRTACEAIFSARLGWDLTDFGLGDFDRTGLLLFTVRNGTPEPSSLLPYAEKLMVVRDHQVTPAHFHWQKVEDIINRGGGSLVIELHPADPDSEAVTDRRFTIHRDGLRFDLEPGARVRLQPGQSITLVPYLYHSFWAEDGTCIVGEVSSVNDDATDNRFLEPVGRFPAIEEDEAARRLLCTDYARLLG